MEQQTQSKSLENETNLATKLSGKTKLILSSGGIKGIAHVGAIKALEEAKCLSNIDTIVGVSVGSIVGTLLNIGFTAIEMRDILMLFDFSKLVSVKLDNLNVTMLFSKLNNIIESFGADDGTKVVIFMRKLFESKGFKEDITFKELFDKTKKKLIIVVTCINTKTPEYLSYDTTPDMSVIKAIRMSSSIPLFFAPVQHGNKYYVDGGCLDGYPMHLFCDNLDQTIGIHLSEEREEVDNITDIESYLFNIIKTFMAGLSNYTVKGYEKNSVLINTKKIGITNMNASYEDKQYLFDLGYNAVLDKYKK